MSKFVLACCVLHNLCIDLDDNLSSSIDDDSRSNEVASHDINFVESAGQSRDIALRRLGELKRNAIADNFILK